MQPLRLCAWCIPLLLLLLQFFARLTTAATGDLGLSAFSDWSECEAADDGCASGVRWSSRTRTCVDASAGCQGALAVARKCPGCAQACKRACNGTGLGALGTEGDIVFLVRVRDCFQD